jgi:hypothetical protein
MPVPNAITNRTALAKALFLEVLNEMTILMPCLNAVARSSPEGKVLRGDVRRRRSVHIPDQVMEDFRHKEQQGQQ